ncbi:hypothetical protein IWW50_004517 [Coemansia erecta]|nr:hypothetical protein GGF43_003207 [Coemansia sp. RSA 2618]KAJ2821736.1 hypothetical protein IWW50_004517 [Coemansia erecta]
MDAPIQAGHNPKQVLTETTKLRILCIMFKNFVLFDNTNSIFANQTTPKFQWLLATITEHQPNLRDYGDNIKPILESFASNQNSRLFCALADLSLWFEMGRTYEILQLTAKHIHSIFRRPPYEGRPYTRELTYAQRLIMIYQVCDNQTWNMLVNAYAALYRSDFGVPWVEQGKFMLNPAAPFPVPDDIFNIICEYHPQARTIRQGVFAPSPSLSIACKMEEDTDEATAGASGLISPRASTSAALKRRAMSAAVKGKTARAMAIAAAGKSRSMSFHNASVAGFPTSMGASNLLRTSSAYQAVPTTSFNSSSAYQAASTPFGSPGVYPNASTPLGTPSAYPSASSWLSAAPTPALSQSALDFNNFIALGAGPHHHHQQLTHAYSAQSATDTLVPMSNSGSCAGDNMFKQLEHQASLKSANAAKYTNSLGLVPATPVALATPSNSSDMDIVGVSGTLSSLAQTSQLAIKSEPQASDFSFHNLFMHSSKQ